MNGFSNADIGAATADVRDVLVDVVVGRRWMILEERGNGHDLPCLAITTLRNIFGNPRLLYRVQLVAFGQTLDGGDFMPGGGRNRDDAGAHCIAVYMDRACAALGDPAAEFGSG